MEIIDFPVVRKSKGINFLRDANQGKLGF